MKSTQSAWVVKLDIFFFVCVCVKSDLVGSGRQVESRVPQRSLWPALSPLSRCFPSLLSVFLVHVISTFLFSFSIFTLLFFPCVEFLLSFFAFKIASGFPPLRPFLFLSSFPLVPCPCHPAVSDIPCCLRKGAGSNEYMRSLWPPPLT